LLDDFVDMTGLIRFENRIDLFSWGLNPPASGNKDAALISGDSSPPDGVSASRTSSGSSSHGLRLECGRS
jgi:hypothetical protein